MRAMVLEAANQPLKLMDIPVPQITPDQVLIRVEACGVCRTDLHILEGDLHRPHLPLVPGHEIIGRVEAIGAQVDTVKVGQRVGVPWLGGTCGRCPYCHVGQENLCDLPDFTGYTVNGGFAEYCAARAAYVFTLSDKADPVLLAPLLCAGLIGFRTMRLAEPAATIGIYGFGAAAHILCQIAAWQGKTVYAFTRDGDTAAQGFAREMGAVWAGGSSQSAPVPLDAALIFAPVGALVPIALRSVRKGGRVICGGIHMTDIPGFPYAHLWEERSIRSVANLTREDGEIFFPLAQQAGVTTHTTAYSLDGANEALDDLRDGRLSGAAVLVP
ncbi:MAG: zinc-dependent alcohol dehydrogenase family protein [Pseudomonadota bacterium]